MSGSPGVRAQGRRGPVSFPPSVIREDGGRPPHTPEASVTVPTTHCSAALTTPPTLQETRAELDNQEGWSSEERPSSWREATRRSAQAVPRGPPASAPNRRGSVQPIPLADRGLGRAAALGPALHPAAHPGTRAALRLLPPAPCLCPLRASPGNACVGAVAGAEGQSPAKGHTQGQPPKTRAG